MPKTRNAFAFHDFYCILDLYDEAKAARARGNSYLADELEHVADSEYCGSFHEDEFRADAMAAFPQNDRISDIERDIFVCEMTLEWLDRLLRRLEKHNQRLQSFVTKYGTNHKIGRRAQRLLEKYSVVRKEHLKHAELMKDRKVYNQKVLRNAFNEELGARIRIARKMKGYTQDEVAEKLGIAESTYSHYELGSREIPPLLIYKLANLLNVSTKYLLGTEIKR